MSANAKVTRVTDAASEPLSLADAKLFLRVEISDDDALISDLITTARMDCETINNRSFITTTWKLTLDYFPPYSGRYGGLIPFALSSADRNYTLNLSDTSITLPYPPLISVSSISYVDQSGATQNLDPSAGAGNVIVSPGTPGQITPAYGKTFPFTQPVLSAVNINYTAGYGSTAASVPRNVVQAIRLLTSIYYENRSSDISIPDAVYRLLDSTRWGAYG